MKALAIVTCCLLLCLVPDTADATVESGPELGVIFTVGVGLGTAIEAVLDGFVIADLAMDEETSVGMRWATGLLGLVDVGMGAGMVVLAQEVNDDDDDLFFALGGVAIGVGVIGIVVAFVADSGPTRRRMDPQTSVSPWVAPTPDGAWVGGVSYQVTHW